MKKITPFLWFDGRAEEAMEFYTSTFKDSKRGTVTRYTDAGPGEKGSVMSVTFELNGQEFYGLNGGPNFQFTPAISFFVECDTQEEIDYYWDKLCEGGLPNQCGWLTDKFGLSWQIVPSILWELLHGGDDAKAARVMRAVFSMIKLDIAGLQAAAAGVC